MSILKRMFGGRKPPVTPVSQYAETAATTADHGQSNRLVRAIEVAFAHQNAGRLQEAEGIYEQVLAMDGANFNALHLLGVLYHQRGEHARGAEKIEAALRVDDASVPAHGNLGECFRAMGRNGDARRCFEKALALQPGWAPAAYNLGNLLQAESNFSAAKACYENALRAQPADIEAKYQLGNVFAAQKNLVDAKTCFEQVLALHPRHAACLASLGNVSVLLGELGQAEDCYRQALAVDPDMVSALINLGNVLLGTGNFTHARIHYERVIVLQPESFDAHLGLGRACARLNLAAEARIGFEKALQLKPHAVVALHGLGNTLIDLGEHQAALDIYRQAVSVDAENAELQWLFTMAHVPALHPVIGSASQARAEFVSALQKLDEWFTGNREKQGYKIVGVLQPFLLAYHEEMNTKIIARYGSLCDRLMRHWPDSERFSSTRRAVAKVRNGDKIRVGFVSAHVHDHSVWNALVKGFVRHLDRTKFDVQVYYLGAHVDQETNWAIDKADYFEHGLGSWQHWAERISNQNPDMLIYPEIGMHAATAKLASLRLAPVQAASWGHPETTGLPTMDYYVSAEYIEPPDAQDYYTERLEKLPNLGCLVEEGKTESIRPDFAAMGVEASVPLLLCPGVPFKYLPENDHVLVDIARRLKQCQFIFFTHRLAGLSMRLKERLSAQFAAAGLNADKFIVFVPWQNKAAFHGVMKHCDVFLDTIGFSGFNTALQGLECGLPIVTREGRFMRGRLGSGLLRRIGLSEFAAQSNNDYVDIAENLASDKWLRIATQDRIKANCGKLFGDLEPVRALERFVEKTVLRE